MAPGDLGTILSRRDYRVDLLAFTALWARGFEQAEARPRLDEIVVAMRSPHYVPYLGRKACPLMLPLDPQVVVAADPVAALSMRAARQAALGLLPATWTKAPSAVMLDAEAAAHFGLSEQVHRVELRRDRLASRRRWQFTLREEAVLER